MKINSGGFTLIEVILAMGVLTTTIFLVSSLMLRSFYRVEECRDDIEKVFIIKRELYANYLKHPKEGKKVVQKIEVPAITITSVLGDIQEKSVFRKLKDKLKIVRSDATWKTDKRTRESSMQSFVFSPKKEEKK